MKNSKWKKIRMNKGSISVFYQVQKFYQDEEQILVNGKDRGGQWEVNNDAQNILSITEKMFRHGTKNFVFRLNEVTLIFEAVRNIKL